MHCLTIFSHLFHTPQSPVVEYIYPPSLRLQASMDALKVTHPPTHPPTPPTHVCTTAYHSYKPPTHPSHPTTHPLQAMGAIQTPGGTTLSEEGVVIEAEMVESTTPRTATAAVASEEDGELKKPPLQPSGSSGGGGGGGGTSNTHLPTHLPTNHPPTHPLPSHNSYWLDRPSKGQSRRRERPLSPLSPPPTHPPTHPYTVTGWIGRQKAKAGAGKGLGLLTRRPTTSAQRLRESLLSRYVPPTHPPTYSPKPLVYSSAFKPPPSPLPNPPTHPPTHPTNSTWRVGVVIERAKDLPETMSLLYLFAPIYSNNSQVRKTQPPTQPPT